MPFAVLVALHLIKAGVAAEGLVHAFISSMTGSECQGHAAAAASVAGRRQFGTHCNIQSEKSRGLSWFSFFGNLTLSGMSLNHGFVNVVLANPEPNIVFIEFHGKGAIFKRHPRGPEFLSAAFG